jgi:hypothetical protein
MRKVEYYSAARPPKSPPKSPPLDRKLDTELAYPLTVETGLSKITPSTSSGSDSEGVSLDDGLFTAPSTPKVHLSSSSSSAHDSPVRAKSRSNSISPSYLAERRSYEKLKKRLESLNGLQPDLHPEAQLLQSPRYSKTEYLIAIIKQKDDEIKRLRERENELLLKLEMSDSV